MVQIQAPDTSPRARRHERLEAVVAAFETPLLRYAARLLHNPAMAQDVVQNVFIKLFRQWPEGMRPTRASRRGSIASRTTRPST